MFSRSKVCDNIQCAWVAGARLHDFIVAVSSSFDGKTYNDTNFIIGATVRGTLQEGETRTIPFVEPIYGRYVGIKLAEPGILTICELQVHGKSQGKYPSSCTKSLVARNTVVWTKAIFRILLLFMDKKYFSFAEGIQTTSGENGWLESMTCVFPFTHANVEYRECTNIGSTEPWCHTVEDGSEGKPWGYCVKGLGKLQK